MIETLRLVKGAVSTKDLVPVMTHFCFYQGRVQGMNGRVAIDAPLPELGISATVPAAKLVQAIDSCKGEPKISSTDTTITIAEGRLKVRLPIQQNDAFPRAEPDPMEYELETPIIPTLRQLRPFVAEDATRPWSIGIWFDDAGLAYATNNVVMISSACDMMENTGRSINLPSFAVDELIRIGREPIGMGISGESVTFWFDDWWLKAQLLTAEWPTGSVAALFDEWPKKLPPVPEGAAEALETVAKFCPDQRLRAVVLGAGKIATSDGDQGAEVDGFDFDPGMFNADYLLPVLRIASAFRVEEAAPSRFACPDGTRGRIVGMRR